jgi:transposase InsO family protein
LQWRIEKPKEYVARVPRDIVQVDTLDVRPLPGAVFKHFSARDMICRWDVLEVHRQATATTARGFLDTLLARSPFSVRAIQVDGGSEFEAAFEEACQERSIRLFVLPPHSPKLNGYVERAHRTHVEEFYEVYDGALDMPLINQALKQWKTVYNTVGLHYAPNRLTPAEYLKHYHPELTPKCSHMY